MRALALLAVAALGGTLLAVPAGGVGELPAPGACPDGLAEGARVAVDPESVETLRPFLPPEVVEHREAFLFDGMQLTVGPCFRRYPPAAFYAAATRESAGTAALDDAGNLVLYRAGLPFPAEAIADDDPRAGAKWAWSFAFRYRGAGPRGALVIHELAPGQPRTAQYAGTWFHHLTRHRADLAETAYRTAVGGEHLWVAGGRFRRPGAAANLAWRQLRPPETLLDDRRSDDIFVYVPAIRDDRRSATAWVDGLFVPRYTASELSTGPVLRSERDRLRRRPLAAGAAASEHIRHGLVGLVLRPNAYRWTLEGERDVLALLNVADRPGAEFDWRGLAKESDPPAEHGPRGVAFDGERWDVRRAVVLEGVPRAPRGLVRRTTLWLDAETAHPLYVVERNDRGDPIQVGMLLHRYSGDADAYGAWPGGVEANVLDPVAASFLAVGPGGATWRRESWGLTSLPVSEEELRRMVSTLRLETLP